MKTNADEPLELEQFLAGPGRDESEIDIDRIFGKTFERVCRELLQDDPNAFEQEEDALTTPSHYVSGYSFVDVKSGLALKAPDGKIVGGYFSCDLSVSEEHQGRGLGAELVIEFFLRNDSIPIWDLDTAAYSPAGYGAHSAAWSAMARYPDMVAKKTKSINEMMAIDAAQSMNILMLKGIPGSAQDALGERDIEVRLIARGSPLGFDRAPNAQVDKLVFVDRGRTDGIDGLLNMIDAQTIAKVSGSLPFVIVPDERSRFTLGATQARQLSDWARAHVARMTAERGETISHGSVRRLR